VGITGEEGGGRIGPLFWESHT